MTRQWRRVFLAASAHFSAATYPIYAQTEGTLVVGGSLVEYEGLLSTSAFVVAPAIKFESPRLTLAGQGSWTAFPSGRGVLQGSAAARWLAGSSSRWRVEISGSAGASKYADVPATGHLLGGARFHLFAGGGGGWVGIQSGGSSGGLGRIPLEITAAGWSVKNRLTLIGTATTTLDGPVRTLDLVGGLRWAGARVELEARAGARRSAQEQEGGVTDAYGEATATLAVGRRIAFWLGGGKYPSDPLRHTVGATYLSAGLRLHATGRPVRGVPMLAGGILEDRVAPAEDGGPPLEIAGSDERRTLRVRVPDAATVEVMGDFTDWVPVSLARASPGVWETSITIPAGLHRVNIRVNGGSWTAPRGARQERTEFGGVVGLVVIPD